MPKWLMFVRSLIDQWTEARVWRVKYEDGKWSVKMDYSTARDYRDIFGGTLHWCRR